MEDVKKCSRCKEIKPRSEYWKRADRPIGITGKCKACYRETHRESKARKPATYKLYARRSHLRKQYKITIAEYNRLFHSQGGKCFGCEKYQHELKRALDVDHCHETKVIRGLLCSNCNRAIGFAKHSQTILKRLVAYLDRLDK